MEKVIENLTQDLKRLIEQKKELDARLQFDVKNMNDTKTNILKTEQEISEFEKAIEKLKEEL